MSPPMIADLEIIDGYPSEAALDLIRSWQPPYEPLFDAIGRAWRWRDYFVRRPRRRREWKGGGLKRTYKVHTGGWSGHEAIIGALQDNIMLWSLCWVQTRRGGHYLFEVPT